MALSGPDRMPEVGRSRAVCLGVGTDASGEATVWVGTPRGLRTINGMLRRKIPLGFVWSSLQINLNTVADWHTDEDGVGPFILLTG